jgi:hypothetical protein
MESPQLVLRQLTGVFDALGIDYVVVGSFASSIHGEYRATGDIDIVADLVHEKIDALVGALKKDFYVDDLSIGRAIARGRSFNIIHLTAIFKVDVFLPATSLGRQQLFRRQRHKLDPGGNQEIWVATAEDTILAKLHWFHIGNEVSEMQWRDVRGIICTQGASLDSDYLRQWADLLGLRNLLERALEESE